MFGRAKRELPHIQVHDRSALLVAAQPQIGGNGIHGLGVLHTLLPDVQLAQEKSKDAGLRQGSEE